MSREITFAVMVGDKFADVDWRTGSHPIYEAFIRYVPYGKIKQVTREMRESIEKSLRDERFEVKRNIIHLEKQIEDIKSLTSHAIEEKMDAIYDRRDSIEQYQEEIEQIDDALRLLDLMDRAENLGTPFFAANDCMSVIENLVEEESK